MDDDDSKVWSLYDAGPKSIRCPIIFLPPVSGTAEVFFQQLLALSGWGYRVISVCSDSFFIILHLVIYYLHAFSKFVKTLVAVFKSKSLR